MIHIVGGGLAGSEIAYQLASRKVKATLYEMRPYRQTPVHKSGYLAELVCSNSLKSMDANRNASGVLKKELEKLDSFVLKIAKKHAIPGGKALVVDRQKFSVEITEILENLPSLRVIRREIKDIPNDDDVWILASGPATSESLYEWMKKTFGKSAYFFDAVAPIIDANSVNMSKVFFANRYDKGKDYLNCPMTKEEYLRFRQALVEAEVLPVEGFDKKLLFSRCQPIEEIARSGVDAMRYGPLKPKGLSYNGKNHYAVVQLRRDDVNARMYNIVGFQTRLKWSEQEKVIHLIPGLERAKILRYGVMHANIYLQSSFVADEFFRSKLDKRIFFAGQITGVEGYVESIASGLYISLNVLRILKGKQPMTLPSKTMMGALFNYVSKSKDLKPMYVNFGLVKKEELEEMPTLSELLGR